MAALSVMFICADSSTTALPVAWAVTVADPSGDAVELTDALPATGASAAGSGEQLLTVGMDPAPDPGGCPSRAVSSASTSGSRLPW